MKARYDPLWGSEYIVLKVGSTNHLLTLDEVKLLVRDLQKAIQDMLAGDEWDGFYGMPTDYPVAEEK
jgi:hypothetical protein